MFSLKPAYPFVRTATGPAVSQPLLILLTYFFPIDVFCNNMSFLHTASPLSYPISPISISICVSNLLSDIPAAPSNFQQCENSEIRLHHSHQQTWSSLTHGFWCFLLSSAGSGTSCRFLLSTIIWRGWSLRPQKSLKMNVLVTRLKMWTVPKQLCCKNIE